MAVPGLGTQAVAGEEGPGGKPLWRALLAGSSSAGSEVATLSTNRAQVPVSLAAGPIRKSGRPAPWGGSLDGVLLLALVDSV